MNQVTKYALGTLIALLLLGLLELGLLAFGAGEPPLTSSLTRGFDRDAQYLIPDPQLDGGWMTQFRWNKEKRIPPKTDRLRVLLFGGSNTAAFPADHLQELLNADLEAPRYEVFNLGRGGYGSARVSLVFAQALERLRPDVVVVYTGHNEFVERGFQQDLDAIWTNEAMKQAAGVAEHLRTYHLMSSGFAALRESPQTKPEKWKGEFEKFGDLEYSETLEFLADYEENVRGMVRLATSRNVGVLLSTVVANRLAPPIVATFPLELDNASLRRFRTLHREALELRPDFMQRAVPARGKDQVQGQDWKVKPRPKGYATADDLAGYRPTRGWLAEYDPMFPVPARWKPRVGMFVEAYGRFVSRDIDAGERSDLEQAEPKLREALEIVPDHPRALFDLGTVLYLLERDEEEIVECFRRSGRFDRAPRKANDIIHESVRRVASEFEAAEFYDANERFSECMDMGLVGWEWMTDHCHLGEGARRALMARFAERILERWPAAEEAR